jgi:hypothetical protein
MPTESSAVSSLIRQVHTRRLDTDPGDDILFGRTKPAQRVAGRPIRLGLSTAPRSSQAHIPVHATAVTAPAAPRAMPRGTHPPIPRRERTWPLVIGAVIMAGIGVGGAWYASQFLDRDAPHAAVAMPTPAPQPAPAAVAVAAAPAVSATAIEPTATAIEPAPAPAPAVEPAAPAPPARHAKSKRATAKHGKRKAAHAAAAAKAEPAKAEPVNEPDPQPAPAPPPPRPTVQRQAADNENPL